MYRPWPWPVLALGRLFLFFSNQSGAVDPKGKMFYKTWENFHPSVFCRWVGPCRGARVLGRGVREGKKKQETSILRCSRVITADILVITSDVEAVSFLPLPLLYVALLLF